MRLAAFVVVVVLSGCTVHKSELDETLEWMDNTYNAHENVSGAYGHGRSEWYAPEHAPNGERIEVLASGMTESFTYRGCDLFLKLDHDPRGNAATEIVQTGKFDFKLRDIDSASIKIRVGSHLGDFSCEADAEGQKSIMAEHCDHATIDFKTRNEAGLINEDWHSIFLKLTGPDHDNHKVGETNNAYFVFDERTMLSASPKPSHTPLSFVAARHLRSKLTQRNRVDRASSRIGFQLLLFWGGRCKAHTASSCPSQARVRAGRLSRASDNPESEH